MSLIVTELKPFFEQKLLEELYVVKGTCVICLLADWRLVAIPTNPNVIEKYNGYVGLYVDQRYIEKYLFEKKRGKISPEDSAAYSQGLTFTPDALKQLAEIKKKIDAGEMKPEYKKDFVKLLKSKYIEQKQELLNKYGNPPAFSEKKMIITALLSILIPYGAPFYYIGKPLWGILILAICMFSCVTQIFWPMIVTVGIGFYLFLILLLFGKVKDRHGLYILSAKRKEQIRHIANVVEKYKNE